MKLTFLGTGAGIPAKQRNVSSLALHLMDKNNTIWLFDCGEATQHQILYSPVKATKITKIFITHCHGDHIYGLPGLLSSRAFHGATTPLTLYGPNGLKDYIDISLKISGTFLTYPLIIKEIDGQGICYEDAEITVHSAELNHGVTSFGYRISQKDKPGPLLISKVKEAGIPEGPVLNKLKKGEKVKLKDGRTFKGTNFTGPPKKGKSVAILGDTSPSVNAVRLAERVDTLVHEATFARNENDLALKYGHSTTLHAAETAKKAGVKQLVMNHISSRYQTAEQKEKLIAEARAIFSESDIAEDLSSFNI
ncbi:ribonuclease Z [Salipaludibacillus aurantiacus]|uniref:Ribonuclease Z n=1 Tax=Salipaludibacillus aurantiacus TaxID=1601833 RepID=A0A1H9NUT4_9BACI|nr:ribonuclease Z [Salipaludibacillus aurantiacus]SER39710.1 ribonuclease Z [Salipaludibacillus aurantiacus]